ncbi:MAG: hypothetical protein IKI08_00760, partial [Selenomonadaceae bacterium]|nr:hypothetical protein [Selenomonadaceae bacterium]
MNDFVFDLQRFATIAINKDNFQTIDGVTYTAITDAVLNLDSDNKVTGIASGSVKATVEGAENSPTVTFDTSDGAINFTASGDGKVITVTQLFPIEFISGSFTYKGNTISIAANSDLAIVNQSEDYSLRNENHFVYDSAYIFTNTSMTSDSQRVISKLILSNGSDTRELNLIQLGKVINNFTERGFTLVKGSSEILTIGSYTLTATALNKDAGMNISLGEDGITLVPNSNDGTLNVTLKRGDLKIISGELECKSGSITLGYDHAVTFAEGTSFDFTWNDYVATISATDEATTNIELTDSGINFTPGTNDGGLNILLKRKGNTIFDGTLNITDGIITFDAAEQKFSFTKGTKIALAIGKDKTQEIDLEITGGSASFKVEADKDGNFTITPGSNDGSIDVTLKRDGETVFENNLSVDGPMILNPTTEMLTLKDGTTVSVTFNNYTLTATASGDTSSTISLTSDGISITPDTTDKGKLKLKLIGTSSGSLSADIEVLSGGFLFGTDGALTVTKGTELQIDFGNNYIVNFKTTNEAGGVLSIGADGITFKPNSDEEDGGLELTVKRGDDSRTASLDVTGSVTYKLDGTISLAKGTVVKNVFDDGNILTITANTDAAGTILFNPQTGLTITPSTAKALDVVLSTGNLDVVKVTSIEKGSITYSGGVITASDGTKARIEYYFGWESDLYTTGGTASIQFTDDRTIYIANAGANFVIDYLDGTTTEIQNGTYSDIYETETSEAIELISVGSTFRNNDAEVVFTLEKAGDYTLNGMKVVTTADNVEVQLSNYDTVIVDGISYTPLDDNVTLTLGEDGATVAGGKVTMQMDGFDTILNFDTTDGSVSCGAGKFTVTKGAKTYLSSDEATQFVAQNNFDINFNENSDGTINFTLDDSADIAIERDGETVLQTTIALDGAIVVNPSTDKISLPKDTVLIFAENGKSLLEITALDDAGGQLSFTDKGIRFAPNENDGKLDLNFVNEGRKANIDVTGAITYGIGGNISLEDGTVVNFTWEDGTNLKLTSKGSTGSIGLNEKGIKITSEDENLTIDLTTATGDQSHLNGIKGTIYYNAGTVSFDNNSTITATTTLGGEPILITLETQGGTGHLDFADNGVIYSADTGAMQITWKKDDLESTFTVNSGSVQIGHGLFQIAEGTDLATDLKDFVPALYFTTSEAGTYIINGQIITTSAANLAMTATDNYMSFKTSDDAVTYDGMTFAGAGNVSLMSGGVVLGAGVEVNGFGEGKSFMLAEAGNVTVDEKVFEADSLKNKLDEDIPLNVSVEGAKDGFTFSREITRESEDYFDDPDYSNVGKIFREEFHAANDDSYRIRTDPIGLEEVIGISKGATISGGAKLADEPTLSYFNLVTDTEGDFTIVDKAYSIGGDSSVAITARFEKDGSAYASAFDSLNGTVSGDFTEHEISINGSALGVQPLDDTLISIAADDSGYKIFGLDDSSLLIVSAKDTYIVNGTTINANAGDYIAGGGENIAYLLAMNNDTVVTGTEFDDYLANHGTNVTINALGGSDTVMNYGTAYVTVNAGAGNDFIFNVARVDSETGEVISSPDNVLINGGAGNDIIYNHGDSITIDGGAGDDSISNNSDNVVFIWSGGDDTIDGFKEDSQLSIGSDYSTQQSGDDVIVTVGDNQIILTGASSFDDLDIIGEDGSTFINYNYNSLVSGTSGNDSITNYGNNSTIQAKSGMDTIFNEAAGSIIDGGDGSDSISNYSPQGVLLSDNVSINAGKGNDTIINEHAYNVTLEGGTGNDLIIVVTGDHTTIYGGAGNDTILGETMDSVSSTWAMGGYSNIDGGTGDDYINPVFSDSASISGGAGNDTIINEGNDTTLNGGAGDDIISLHGASLDSNVIKYEAGDGNDTIYGFNETSKLSITAGTDYSSIISGEDVIVNVGSNKITIADGAGLSTINITNEKLEALNTANTVDNTLITGTELADTINNAGDSVTIKAMAGNDSIVSSGSEGSLNGSAGDDILENSGNNSTLLGEYGNDTILNSGDEVLINGGYGNDTISNSGDFVSINGGSGNNLIGNTGDNVLISMTGGLDTIYGFSENSTLSLSTDDYETLYGGKDIIVRSGSDFALLKNAFYMNDSININGKTIEVTNKVLYLLPGGDEATIGRSNISIVSGDGDDQISLTSNAKNNVIQYETGNGNDTIYGYNETSKLSISGDHTFVRDGDDVIFKVGDESITVVDGGSVIDLGFEDGEEIVLTKKGSAVTVDGKVFELTKSVPDGVTITGERDGFTSSITEDGKIFVEEFIAQDDDNYTVQANGKGLQTISGIDAGTTVTTSATKDGEESKNLFYIVTEDAGDYTLNDMKITTTKANTALLLGNEEMAFDADAGVEYGGKTFSGDGRVAVSVDSMILGSSVSASGFDKGESFILAQKGTTTVDGRVFELTEDISDGGVTIEANNNGYNTNVLTDGKILAEEFTVTGDENYSVQVIPEGLKKLSGISNGATILGGGTYGGQAIEQYFYLDTDTEGTFTIGEKTYSISGDSNVEIEASFNPDESFASGFNNLDGTVSGDFAGDSFYVNDKNPILIHGDEDFYVVGSSSGTKLFGVSGNATLASLGGVKEVHTDTEGTFQFGEENNTVAVTVQGDDNVTFELNSAEYIKNIA